jgi:hypothetical protein
MDARSTTVSGRCVREMWTRSARSCLLERNGLSPDAGLWLTKGKLQPVGIAEHSNPAFLDLTRAPHPAPERWTWCSRSRLPSLPEHRQPLSGSRALGDPSPVGHLPGIVIHLKPDVSTSQRRASRTPAARERATGRRQSALERSDCVRHSGAGRRPCVRWRRRDEMASPWPEMIGRQLAAADKMLRPTTRRGGLLRLSAAVAVVLALSRPATLAQAPRLVRDGSYPAGRV